MSTRQSATRPVLGRRRFAMAGGVAAALLALGSVPRHLLAAGAGHAATVAALRRGVQGETGAHRRYVLFGRLAKEDGYRGLAYLYTALASSELIHAQHYDRVLAKLGVPPAEVDPVEVPTGSAKDNLIYAAEREFKSIEETYPALLAEVETEGYADAVSAVRYAWASHQQHLEIITKIRRWSPSFFETVARRIDEGTDRYYVCQVCGATVTAQPTSACPVCDQPAAAYKLIPPDRFY